MGDEAYLRSLLSQPWSPGRDGKGLVLADGTLRTWVTDAGGDVHHSPAMELLGLNAAALVAFIAIAPDGAVTAWPTSAPDAEARTAAALAADERLHTTPADEWRFG